MRFYSRICVFVVACSFQVVALRVNAEAQTAVPQAATPPAVASPIKQASFTHAAAGDDAAQTIHFGRQAARVGDRIEQNMSLEMRLKLTMRRENELVGNNQTTVRTKQHRIVVATAVESGMTMAARVQYPEATKQVIAAEAASGTAQVSEAVAQYPAAAQPVEGKTYLCQREPGENGILQVTDEKGNRPPTEEYDIVAAQMDMIGRPNPLAQFLGGRDVKVGERFELPKDLATKVFNLGDKFGEVTNFELTLQKIESQDGAQCGVFLANVEAAANGASQMRLQVQGPLVVQADSCRAVRVDMNGPIGMSETRGSYSTAYQVIGTGHLQTSISATYREAQRN